MVKTNPHLEEIANKVNLTTEDLDAIEQTRRQRKGLLRILAAFETIVGLISFIAGFTLSPFSEISGYPYFQFLLVGNVSLLSQNKKIKSLTVFVILTLIISLVGGISGYVIGSVFKTSVVSLVRPTLYGVYFEDR